MSKTTVIRIYLVSLMVVLSFISYNAFTTPMPTREPDKQVVLNSQVPDAKPGKPPKAVPVAEGEALSYMEIPRFGDDWLWATVEGITPDSLEDGPGHFPNSALPGAKGNVAFAAHRATHGDPFLDFDLLRKGDRVTLSQNGARWEYEITLDPVIIEPDEGWVVKNMEHGRWLTLVTCWPKYGAEKRMYVRAKLVDVEG